MTEERLVRDERERSAPSHAAPQAAAKERL